MWCGSPRLEEFPNNANGPAVWLNPCDQRFPELDPFDGLHYEGTLDQWQYGIPIALAVPQPDICGIPLIASDGGVLIGGTAWGSATAIGSLHQAQRLTGRVSDQVDAVGSLHQAQTLRGSIWSGSHVSGFISQAQRLIGTIATRVTSSGQAAEASGASGSTSVVVASAGTAAEASGASGSTSTTTSVRGSLAQAARLTGRIAVGATVLGSLHQAEKMTGQSPTGAAVQGSLGQAQTMAGEVSGGSSPVNPITFDCTHCSGGSYTYWYFSLSGITGSSDCIAQNGNHTLAHNPGACSWNDTQTWPGGLYHVQLSGFTSPFWTLTFFDSTSTQQAQYGIFSGWSCLGPTNTLSLLSSTSCAGWPATITLSS